MSSRTFLLDRSEAEVPSPTELGATAPRHPVEFAQPVLLESKNRPGSFSLTPGFTFEAGSDE